MTRVTSTGLRSALLLAVALAAVLFVPVAGRTRTDPSARPPVHRWDLSALSDASPSRPLPLLFIHHSCGGQLLAEPGPSVDRASCIYSSHPNGGGLRRLLNAQGYDVHEASYGSAIGEHTDLFDWLPKFRSNMPEVLAVDENDRRLPDGKFNEIVVFKSCFTQSDYAGEGSPPGNPDGPALTVWNAKATLSALLTELRKRPDVLFVYVTAPPLAPPLAHEPLWRVAARALLGRPNRAKALLQKGAWARQVDDWVVSTDGWLAAYPEKNVVVFDYYDVLTEGGRSNLSRFATGDGADSHPSSAGNEGAAAAFVPLLNRAVRRAGLSE
jgi:hypothetical protein